MICVPVLFYLENSAGNFFAPFILLFHFVCSICELHFGNSAAIAFRFLSFTVGKYYIFEVTQEISPHACNIYQAMHFYACTLLKLTGHERPRKLGFFMIKILLKWLQNLPCCSKLLFSSITDISLFYMFSLHNS
jgi:hypothetical protein